MSETGIAPTWHKIVRFHDRHVWVRRAKGGIIVRVVNPSDHTKYVQWSMPKWVGLDGAVSFAETDQRGKVVAEQ
jgi:hypothetical protein